MVIRDITPEEQLFLDPTGRIRSLMKGRDVTVQRVNPVNPWFTRPLTSQEALAWFTDRMTSLRSNAFHRHKAYYDYWDEMADKYGPQGGVFPMSVMKESYTESYKLAERSPVILATLKRGRDYLCDRIARRASVCGIAQLVPPQVLNTYSGVPIGGKKGEWFAEHVLGSDGQQFYHLLPVVPGQRYMRRKMRTINQDATANVRYIEQELAAVRNWLKNQFPNLFAAWLNPRDFLYPQLGRVVSRGWFALEMDYLAMDVHYSLEVAEFLLPIYELLLPHQSFVKLQCYVYEAFHQPLYWGSEMWEGKHNLFSGIAPTSDFETLYSICLQIGLLLSHGCDPSEAVILAIGDDCLVSSREFTRKVVVSIREEALEVSAAAGLELHPDKTRITTNDYRFCRRVYYPSCRRASNGVDFGAYPSILALNSLVNPERLPESRAIALVSALSICDNAQFSPEWSLLTQFVARFLWLDVDIQQLVDAAPIMDARDWWFRVYGEHFNPAASPSYQAIIRSVSAGQ